MYNPLYTRLGALLVAALMGSTAYAQSSSASSSSSVSAKPVSAQVATDRIVEAQTRVNDAVEVVGKMKGDAALADLLGKAKGVVIVPHFTQAALVFGGRGGGGLLVVRRDRTWTSPAFYKLGGGTFGVQIGGSSGSIALLLMSDKAVAAFENNASTWSMSAGAGLNAISYNKQTPETQSLSDVIAWSDMKGLFGGAAVGATNVSRDLIANQAYYKSPDVTSQQILSGAVTNSEAKILLDVMPPPAAPAAAQKK
jgi:lipid-binding SYLF domain-containing protein